VARGSVDDLLSSESVSLADQVAMDGWLPALTPCAKWTDESTTVTVALRIAPGGNVAALAGDSDALDRCVLDVVRTKHVAPGGDRLLSANFEFQNPDLPRLETDM